MNKLYFLLGSNMGNSKNNLLRAQKKIEELVGVVIRRSHLYKTAAWGNTNQADFLNQVIVVYSKYSVEKILEKILVIEMDMGRIRTRKNAPRLIDIDILFFNKETIQKENLTVPHPAIQLRRFVLVPLNELSPNFIHPVLHKTIHCLLLECPDELAV
ncbi:MAG: 2-amino-4-hydroxy-6-hydroxymethyldihydropteridine diphosphokinase, partial [Ferruginibacter sp.]